MAMSQSCSNTHTKGLLWRNKQGRNVMRSHFSSLRTKVLFTTFTFLVILAAALAGLVTYGFSSTQQNAKQQSIAGLQAQGRDSLRALIEREGQLTTFYLQQPAEASRTAATYLSTLQQISDNP